MWGIFTVIGKTEGVYKFKNMSKRMGCHGPDKSGSHLPEEVCLFKALQLLREYWLGKEKNCIRFELDLTAMPLSNSAIKGTKFLKTELHLIHFPV